MARLFAAVLVVLALAGCSTATVPPVGLTADEIDDVREQILDMYWQSTGLSDDLRPPNPRVTVISQDEWTFAYVKCMFASGFEDYVELDGGYTIGDRDYEDRSDAEIVADFVCATSLEVDGQYEGLLNDAQLDYAFDYYAHILVPCLALQGFEVVHPPTREQFSEGFGNWHPYYAIQQGQQEAFFADTRVIEICPPMPDGIPDPGFARMWEFR